MDLMSEGSALLLVKYTDRLMESKILCCTVCRVVLVNKHIEMKKKRLDVARNLPGKKTSCFPNTVSF